MEREAAPVSPRESILLSPEEAEPVHNLTAACGGWGGDEKTGRSRVQLPTRPHREHDMKKARLPGPTPGLLFKASMST